MPAAPVPVRGSGPDGEGGCVDAVLPGSTVVDTVPPSDVTLPGAVDDVVAEGFVVEAFNGVVVDADGEVVALVLVVEGTPGIEVDVNGAPVVVVVALGFVVTLDDVVVTLGIVVVAPGTLVVVLVASVQSWLKIVMPSDVQFLPS
jgi:hypothetical protein